MWFSPMAYSIQRYVIFMCVQLLLREKWCPMRKRLQKYYIRDLTRQASNATNTEASYQNEIFSSK